MVAKAACGGSEDGDSPPPQKVLNCKSFKMAFSTILERRYGKHSVR